MRDRAAECPGDRRAQQCPARQHRARVTHVLLGRHRVEPLRLRIRPGDPVVEPGLLLTPAALEGEPLEPRPSSRVGRHGDRSWCHLALRLARVVAADAGAALAVFDVDRRAVEGRVRAGGRVDDRVLAALLDLLIRPLGALAAAVLEQPHLRRPRGQRPPRAAGVEDDLHPLPVRLVDVVELVEVVVEPVLDGELLGARLAANVGVDDRRRLAGGDQVGEVLRVGAAGVERVAGQVQIPALAAPGDVGRPRARLRRAAAARRCDQLDPGVVEHGVDRGRLVLLGGVVAGELVGGPQHHDRRVAIDQLRTGVAQRRRGSQRQERQPEPERLPPPGHRLAPPPARP